MLKLTDENYCATIVRYKKLITLKNCDNVVGTSFFGNQVIIPKTTTLNTLGVYFPAGCKLSSEFLRNNNLYRDASLNLDGEKKGYFETNGRVKAMLFRKHESSGMWMPIECLAYTGLDLSFLKENERFNFVGDDEIASKYIPVSGSKASNASSSLSKMDVDENQFTLHYKTKHLAENIEEIQMDSVLSVTIKIHGTSAVSSRPLTKRKYSLVEKIKRMFGWRVNPYAYRLVTSSRGVIKDPLKPVDGYDLWIANTNENANSIAEGVSVYGEICGAYPEGKLIQKNYDYSFLLPRGKKNGFFVYRVTYTTPSGKVFEYNWNELQNYCNKKGLEAVPLRYYGLASELAEQFLGRKPENVEELREAIVDGLKKEIEVMEPFCKNVVPREGYCIRVENVEKPRAFKLKSFLFKKYEDEELDKGELDIETEQSL